MSRITILFTFLILSFGCTNALADIFVANNTSSGWYAQTGYNIAGNTNYSTGNESVLDAQINDYFTFDLTGLSGAVTAASFNFYSWDANQPSSGTYSIYTTSLTPAEVGGGCSSCVATYDALTSGSLIGSISITPAENYSVLTIDFNAAGLAWLTANEGTGIVLGGSEPEPADSNYSAFGASGLTATNNLTITTAVPEPTSVLLLASAVLAVGMVTRKTLSRKLDS